MPGFNSTGRSRTSSPATQAFSTVLAGREVLETISARCVGFMKIRRLQDENRAAHSLVDFAMDGDRSRFIENDGGGLFVFPKTAEVESFGFRIGKDVVVGVVHIRKIDRCSDENRQEIGRECDIFLRYLGRRFGGVVRLRSKIAF